MFLIFFLIIIFSLPGISLTIIDVRTVAEWKTGHLDGAIHIEWQDILQIPSKISKDEEIYLYCRSGIDLEKQQDSYRCRLYERFKCWKY